MRLNGIQLRSFHPIDGLPFAVAEKEAEEPVKTFQTVFLPFLIDTFMFALRILFLEKKNNKNKKENSKLN